MVQSFQAKTDESTLHQHEVRFPRVVALDAFARNLNGLETDRAGQKRLVQQIHLDRVEPVLGWGAKKSATGDLVALEVKTDSAVSYRAGPL